MKNYRNSSPSPPHHVKPLGFTHIRAYTAAAKSKRHVPHPQYFRTNSFKFDKSFYLLLLLKTILSLSLYNRFKL